VRLRRRLLRTVLPRRRGHLLFEEDRFLPAVLGIARRLVFDLEKLLLLRRMLRLRRVQQ
jgi:hypothetical protein